MVQIPLLTDEKRCSGCKRWLPVSQFRRRMMRGKPYVEARCVLCSSLAIREYEVTHRRKVRKTRQKWYAKNRARLREYARTRYLMMHRDRIDFIEWLKTGPCLDCDMSFPTCCMDFDHCVGEKLFNISHAVRSKFSNEEIMTELAKCELVCANCHRIRTANRKRG
jgi:hypothetical protein